MAKGRPRGGAHRGAALHALVLAAGLGARFGGKKLFALYRGRPLLSSVLDIVAAGCERRLLKGAHVIIAAHDARARALAESASLEPIVNAGPHLGLSYSLRLGLTELENRHAEVGAAVVFLGDQPLVRLAVVEALIAAWRERGGAVVRPRYAGDPHTPGHPVLLDRSIWRLVRQIEGDHGLGGLLASGSVQVVPVDVPGKNPDVDTVADLQALEESR